MRFPSAYRRTPRGNFVARGLLSNQAGATSVEFALVALPFFMFVIAIIGFGLYFMNSTWLKYAVDSAARIIRTGELNTAGAKGAPITVGEFQTLVCNYARPVLDCSKLKVLLTSASNWAGIVPPSCTGAGGSLSESTGASKDAVSKYTGGANDVVLVTVCYKWDLADQLSFLKMPSVLQSSAAFKSEPYSN